MNAVIRRRGRPGIAWTAPALAAFAAATLCASPAFAGPLDGELMAQAADLSRLSLEELGDVEITSVSRAPEALETAASAIFVITADDIRRSGATSLPEVLRLAPNLEVARIDSMNYAISARGFNSKETANKLLVLVDGRTIYSPLFSGVLWDTYEVPLQDIERIEVISGPGGALYGANAVNGVINIITRKAQDTTGGAARVVVGDDERKATVRYGAPIGDTGAGRVYVTAFDRENSYSAAGAPLDDDAFGYQAGFRVDWGVRDRFTLQGDAYDREVPNRDITGPIMLQGFNLTGRWTRTFDDGSSLMLQGYYLRDDRKEPELISTERTWDLFGQYSFTLGERHSMAVGGGYRLVDSRYDSTSFAYLLPAHREVSLYNLFVHDRIALTDALELTLGLKLEDSSYDGADLELLPSVRLGWTVDPNTFFWIRTARAVRTPSRIDRDLTFPGFLVGGSFRSETLWAYEAGYRGRPAANTALTVVGYFHDYDDLRTAELMPPGVFPLQFKNGARGQTWGVEAWGIWDATEDWRLRAGATWLERDFELKPGSLDITGIASQGDSPGYQLQLRSQWDVTDTVEFDVGLRAIDELSTIPSYVEADARLAWRFIPEAEIALVGQNLINDKHFESDDAGRRRQFGRSVMLQLRWRG